MSYGVKVVYCNAKLQPVCDKYYDLNIYLELLKNDLLRMITDVEDIIYECNDNAAKDEWPDEVWMRFCKLKHKILDRAGDIGRLAGNIYEVKEEEHGQNYLGQAGGHTKRVLSDSSCGGAEP